MQQKLTVRCWSACPFMFVSAPSFHLLVHLIQVGMCVVQVLESDFTYSQQDSINITTDLSSEVAHLKTLLVAEAGKTQEAQQQHVADEAQSAAQVANLKTCMDTELAALTSQLGCEQKRRVAAEEQHKAAQADLALASEVTEQLKSDQAVLLTKVRVVSVLVKPALSDRYVMHWCLPQAVNLMLLTCMPIVSARSSCRNIVIHCAHKLLCVASQY